MHILLFLGMNLMVAATSYLLAYKAVKNRGFIDSLICLFVFYLSQIIAGEIILGIFGILYLKNLIILNALFFIAVYLLTRNLPLNILRCDIRSNLKNIFQSRINLFCISVIAAFVSVKLFINLTNPPFGWDSLNYHFTFAVEWLKHGNLNIPITVFDDPSPTYYPLNGSLFYLWLMFPFKSVFLADLGQLPFFIVAVLSVYAIARKIGLDIKLSFAAAVLFTLVPNFFKQLQIAYVDIMVASLFLVCVNWLFLLSANFKLSNVLVFSLGLGLLIGTKTVALPYSILLLIPFGAIFLKNLKKINLLFVALLAIVALGGFSYLRNFMETGNPLYPLDYRIFNMAVFKGVMAKSSYTAHFTAFDYSLAKMLFHEGLGLQGMLIMLPAALLAFPIALLKKRKETDFYSGYFFLLPLLLYFAWRYILPLANLRYLYAAMGMAIVCGFYILNTLGAKKVLINTLILLCVVASSFELAKRQELVVSLISSVVMFLVFLNFRRIKVKASPAGILLLVAVFGTLVFSENYYNANEYPRYRKMVKYSGFWPEATEAWDWLNKNTYAENIAYAGRPMPFPLYGSNFKNDVYYVSVNKTEPAKLHYFSGGNYEWGGSYEEFHRNHLKKGNYRQDASFSDWLANLLNKKTDYLFIYSLQRTKETRFPPEDSWAFGHPEIFRLVFKNRMVKIYKILAK